MIIFMSVLVILLFLVFSYQLYSRFQLETLDSDSPKMKRKINFYKQQENNRSLLFLMIAIIMLCLILLGILYNQETLRKDNKELELKIEKTNDGKGNAAAEIKNYQQDSLELAKFPWKKIVENRDTQVLDDYELQLIKDWQPFFGESNVTIMVSQKTETVTISVFPTGLSLTNFQIVEKNISAFVNELQSVKEITMIDFNCTYYNQTNKLSKQSFVYSRASKDENLEKVDLG